MTVGSKVKGSYLTVKSAAASLDELALKTQCQQSKRAFSEAEKLLSEVKSDLQKQVIFLAREEPQYK